MSIKLIVILALLSFTTVAYTEYCTSGNQIKIAVVDTGFGHDNHGLDAPICASGHMDYTGEKTWTKLANGVWVPYDFHGHGTNIVGLIENHLIGTKIDHCFIILKYYHTRSGNGRDNLQSTVEAFNYAAENKYDYLNYSSGGSDYAESEKKAVLRYLETSGHLIVAAGNDGKKLTLKDPYYPAMYDKRIVVVGNLTTSNVRVSSSNYGDYVTRWELGVMQKGYGISMSGTSQATANATGKIILENHKQCDIGKKDGTSRTQSNQKSKSR